MCVSLLPGVVHASIPCNGSFLDLIPPDPFPRSIKGVRLRAQFRFPTLDGFMFPTSKSPTELCTNAIRHGARSTVTMILSFVAPLGLLLAGIQLFDVEVSRERFFLLALVVVGGVMAVQVMLESSKRTADKLEDVLRSDRRD